MKDAYILDFGVNFINFLSDLIMEENPIKTDFSNICVIFPSKRPGRYLANALSKKLENKPFFPPKVFSTSEFASFIFSKKENKCREINDLDGSWIIYKILDKFSPDIFRWEKSIKFDRFFMWGKEIFSLLDRLDKENISNEALVSIEKNAQIGYEVPEEINKLLQNLISIRKEYHQALSDYKLTTPGFNMLFCSHIDEDYIKEYDRVYFAGFFALTGCEKKLIKNLIDRKKACLILQKNHEKWDILDDTIKFMGVIPEYVREKHKNNVKIFSCFDTHSQVVCTGHIIKNLKSLKNTAVVLPSENALMPLLLNSVSKFDSKYNISIGYPLARTPIYTLLDSVVKCQINYTDGQYYTKDYLNLIMHPYIKNIGHDKKDATYTRVLIHKIEEVLLGVNQISEITKKPFISLEEIENNKEIFKQAFLILNSLDKSIKDKDELKEHLKAIHNQFFRAFENVDTISELARKFDENFSFIFKNSPAWFYAFSPEIFEQFFQVMSDFKKSLFSKEHFSEKETLYEIFKSHLLHSTVPFEGSSIENLQILGMLEARMLNFDNIILLDVNEGVVPTSKKYNSIIPIGIFEQLGLPAEKQNNEIFRYHFSRMVEGAQNAFLLYQKTDEKERSRFIEQIVWNKEKEKKSLNVFDIKETKFKINIGQHKVSIKKDQDLIDRLGNFVFSSSSIDTYIKCPVRFYCKYILSLEEKEDISLEAEYTEIGNCIHEILHNFFNEFEGKTMRLTNNHKKKMLDILEEKFLQRFKNNTTGNFFMLKEIMQYRLMKLFEKESERNGKIKILHLEETFPEKVALMVEIASGNAMFTGKIDRVDLREDGNKKEIVVIDYKTGYIDEKIFRSVDNLTEALCTRKEIKEKMGSLQLPIYIYLLHKTKGYKISELNASLYSIKKAEEKKLFGENQEQKDFFINNVFLPSLKNVLEEILNPKVEFLADDSNEQYCLNCPFQTICKR